MTAVSQSAPRHPRFDAILFDCDGVLVDSEPLVNKLIWQIMEIIRNDSVQHHRVQQFIIDSLTTTPISLTPDELGEVWQEIEAHDEVERDIIKMAKQLRDDCPLIVQRQLIDYLIYDEEKHDKLLTQLNEFKKKVSGPA